MEDGRCEGEKRFGDVTISKSGLAWAGASSGGLRLGISIRQAGSSFAPWPPAEAIRELFAIPSGGGAESMPGWRCGQSAACELLPEVGRVNRGAKTMVA